MTGGLSTGLIVSIVVVLLAVILIVVVVILIVGFLIYKNKGEYNYMRVYIFTSSCTNATASINLVWYSGS